MWHGDCYDGKEPCCGPLGYFFNPLHNGPFRASRLYSDTPHSLAFLWTSDRHDAETSTCTAHSTHKRERHPCPLAGFEPAIPAGERSQIHFLDRAATGIGHPGYYTTLIQRSNHFFRRDRELRPS
jgi:hypothetical protein